MTETLPTAPPLAAAPTMVQRALRWIAYGVAGLVVAYAVLIGFDSLGDVAVYLILTAFFVAASLISLPDTLPAGLKLAVCSGGALVGVAMIWALYQVKPEFTHYGMIFISVFIAPVARMLAALWMGEPKSS